MNYAFRLDATLKIRSHGLNNWHFDAFFLFTHVPEDETKLALAVRAIRHYLISSSMLGYEKMQLVRPIAPQPTRTLSPRGSRFFYLFHHRMSRYILPFTFLNLERLAPSITLHCKPACMTSSEPLCNECRWSFHENLYKQKLAWRLTISLHVKTANYPEHMLSHG